MIPHKRVGEVNSERHILISFPIIISTSMQVRRNAKPPSTNGEWISCPIGRKDGNGIEPIAIPDSTNSTKASSKLSSATGWAIRFGWQHRKPFDVDESKFEFPRHANRYGHFQELILKILTKKKIALCPNSAAKSYVSCLFVLISLS